MHPPRISQNFSKLQKKKDFKHQELIYQICVIWNEKKWIQRSRSTDPNRWGVCAAQNPKELSFFFQGTFNRRLCMYRLLALFATERFGLIKVGMGIRETLVGFAMIKTW